MSHTRCVSPPVARPFPGACSPGSARFAWLVSPAAHTTGLANWLGTAEDIITGLSTTDDIALVAQTYMMLGNEFRARDERESGLYCYRAALDVLKHSEVLHLSRWSRYAILMDSEMHVD